MDLWKDQGESLLVFERVQIKHSGVTVTCICSPVGL